MKRFLLLTGLILGASGAFSQQPVSGQKKIIATPVPAETAAKQEPVSDSLAQSSMNRTVNPAIPIEPALKENPAKEPQQTPVLNTMKRKPE